MLNLQLLNLDRKERMDLIEQSNDFKSKYRVYFKLAGFTSHELQVKVWQLENNKHLYFSSEELQKITNDLLLPYLKKGTSLEIDADPYYIPLDEVNHELRQAG